MIIEPALIDFPDGVFRLSGGQVLTRFDSGSYTAYSPGSVARAVLAEAVDDIEGTGAVMGEVIRGGVLSLDSLIGLDEDAIVSLGGRVDHERGEFIFGTITPPPQPCVCGCTDWITRDGPCVYGRRLLALADAGEEIPSTLTRRDV